MLFDDVRRTIFVFVLLLGEIPVTQRNSASLTTQCPISAKPRPVGDRKLNELGLIHPLLIP